MLFIPTAFALVALCTTRRAQAQGPYTFKDCKYVDIVKNHVISAFCPASDNFDNSYTSNIVNGTTKNGIVQGKFTLMDLDLCLGRQEHVLTAQADGGGLDGATGCHLTEPPDVKLVDCVGTNGFTADPFVLANVLKVGPSGDLSCFDHGSADPCGTFAWRGKWDDCKAGCGIYVQQGGEHGDRMLVGCAADAKAQVI